MSPTSSIGLGHYLVTWAVLMALGILSYGLVFVSLAPPWGIAVALFIAAIKALLVALVFMHLLQHRGSVRLVAAFGAGFVLLLVVLMVVDVQNRTEALSPGP